MIRQYTFTLEQENGGVMPFAWAYRLYAWMLTQIPSEAADALHRQGEKPIAQYLTVDRNTRRNVWVVSLLSDDVLELLSPVLDDVMRIPLNAGAVRVVRRDVQQCSAEQLVAAARQGGQERHYALRFVSPTAFKSEGRYAIFPQEQRLLQSMVTKWNTVFPELPLDDPDAMRALERGLHIVDYSLHTTRCTLKGVRIPGFYGRVVVESRLPVALEEIWRLLLCAATYTGVGIKTTLGMGGVQRETMPSRGDDAGDMSV